MAGVSSSTSITANPGKLGGLHALAIAAVAGTHVDWRSEGADFMEPA